MDVSCLILAGGKSNRLKEDKAFLLLNEKPLVTHVFNVMKEIFSDIVIVVKNTRQRKKLERIIDGVRIIEDKNKIYSPLSGIKEGIKHVKNGYVFVVACDMPFIHKEIVLKLISEIDKMDCVVPVWNDGRYEPLCTIYRKDVFAKCELTSSLHELIDNIPNKILTRIEDAGTFFNINTKEDLNSAEEFVKSSLG